MRTSSFTHSLSAATTLMLVALILLFTGSSAWATYPGQNGKIVFVSNRAGSWQLYTINPDGSDMRQITNLPPTDNSTWFPNYSPDGHRIVFSNDSPDAPGASNLYLINPDGTGLTKLTNDGLSQLPRWALDGTRIVFAHTSALGTNVITTMPADGTGEIKPLTVDVWDAFGNAYTPEGRHIVFSSQLGGLVTATWIMNENGSNKRRLTPAPLELGGPDVSPDGQHIVVFNSSGISAINIDAPHITQLTHPGNAHDETPNYSPDGTKIVFMSDRMSTDGSTDLFTMNADGSDIKRIATGLTVGGCPDGNCLTPSWGPKP